MWDGFWDDIRRLFSDLRLSAADLFRGSPAMRVYSPDAQTVVVEISVPEGFTSDEVDVAVDRRLPHVRGRVVHRYVEREGVRETRRAFAWSFPLPVGVDPDRVRVERGPRVLRVVLLRRTALPEGEPPSALPPP
ncbi:Hsp20/alpha crystallin family protein [Brockia lithotrophica]|uniref:HSP20 family molecular chaperone IbpA n=1 Tax=Brockia lithotrophica TaxID=933949 RepID=A0A660L6Q0_9BACL|nr:Hsp20/alpha crystallin family protein [Brockia lithotrophica]RKQ88512.1 HSP20 family molecular chaperone IbpA [Brockia lithotrophica]